jgi:hypothetical protein
MNRREGQDTEIGQTNLRFSKYNDMTIHWKALEEHFLMVPLVFGFTLFWGKNIFSELFSKKPLMARSEVHC